MEPFLEIKRFDEPGYSPVVFYGGWHVALSNDSPLSRRENLKKLSRHLLTDEVFILLDGTADLYYADGEKAPVQIHVQHLEKGLVYNVKRGVWHAVATGEGAHIAIVENAETSEENSVDAPIKTEMLP